jgi:hypothetical protein
MDFRLMSYIPSSAAMNSATANMAAYFSKNGAYAGAPQLSFSTPAAAANLYVLFTIFFFSIHSRLP